MRLEPLCELELVYRHVDLAGGKFVRVQPYDSEEGTGYGEGDGTITGERLTGTMRWINHPHRRSDGVMLPDLHGLIRTDDGAMVMLSLQGRTVFGPSGTGGQLLAALFETDDERYRWLNDTFCVLEGAIMSGVLSMRARVYACVNELI